jgi:aminopeptidase-like protein
MPDSTAGEDVGLAMHRFIADLYPICRSITGAGVRETLARIGRRLPLTITETPSGADAFDWTVPKEWNIADAWIKDPSGRKIVDFQTSNLHVLNYSTPIRARMRLEELRPHLFTLPDQPDRIPYRTSYYAERWGFCLPHALYETLAEGEYEVCIESTLEDGALTYGEAVLPGETEDEILISCHVCHPSLCNDNLSGVAVATFLGQRLAQRRLRHSVRLLFIPGTIGSIVWLSRNEAHTAKIKHGLVLTGVGDSASFTYKRSRRGDAAIDRAAEHVLRHADPGLRVQDFSPYGYDERQFCSPGFNLPVGCLMRSPWGTYDRYHTSGDDLDFVHPESLRGTLDAVTKIIDALDRDARYINTNPKGEPRLGKRGLYRPMGGAASGPPLDEMALLWVLNLSDGDWSLLQIAERARYPFETIARAADALIGAGLLRPAD